MSSRRLPCTEDCWFVDTDELGRVFGWFLAFVGACGAISQPPWLSTHDEPSVTDAERNSAIHRPAHGCGYDFVKLPA